MGSCNDKVGSRSRVPRKSQYCGFPRTTILLAAAVFQRGQKDKCVQTANGKIAKTITGKYLLKAEE
jgi:hypothetical protein